MAEAELRVLVVEDVPTDAELALRELKKAGMACKTVRAETRADYLRHLDGFTPDIILSDFALPHFDGMSALALAREKCPDVPFIFVSGTMGEETAIESLKSGATDYILKTNLARLAPAVQRALREARDHVARREAELMFKGLLEYAADAQVIVDGQGGIVLVNLRTEKMFGYRRDEMLGQPVHALLPSALHAAHAAHLEAYFKDPHPRAMGAGMELRGRRKDGSEFPIEVSLGPLQTPGGILISAAVRDVTKRKAQEARIIRLNRVYSVLSGINGAIVRIKDRKELLREVCRIAVEDGGFKLAWVGLLDRKTLDIRPNTWMGDGQEFLDCMRLSAREDVPGGRGVSGRAIRARAMMVVNDVANDERLAYREETLRSGFGSFVVLPLLVESEPIGSLYFYAADTGFFDQSEIKLLAELAGDISFALEHIEKSEKLDYLAYYDALTGLPNLQLFNERASQSVHSAQHDNSQVALVMFDLQRFSIINDTLGRTAGDAVLKEVSARVRHVLQERHLLARIGADLFAILLVDIKDAAGVAHILEREIMDAVSQPFSVGGQELRPSIRCGVALFPEDGADADVLFRNAEAARKKARESGDRYLFYAPQMNAMVAERLDLENRLRIAIANEQFVLHYQPKVNIVSNRVVGLEALIRWQSPGLGLVPPHRFIPLLEETGMILDVGRWALRQAVRDSRQWVAKGLKPPRIAVNISSQQLRQKDFAEEVKEIIVRGGGETPAIDLEITESLIMENIEQCSAKLDVLKSAGIGIAIDDFGTGYSSLSYLARLPVSSLKIDRSFIVDMTNNPDHMAIVSTIISLAHSLNLTVIAEGVETQEQLNLLKLLKCDEMQGYLFSKPLPAAEVVAKFGGAPAA